jgi:hypothetical protein
MLSCGLSLTSFESRSVRSIGWACASILAAVGAWSTLALLDVIGAPNGPARVGLLPPWWLFAVLVVSAGAASFLANRAGANPDLVLPLCALGLLALPYLPWLPDRVPAVRALAGPGRNLLWIVIIWVIASRMMGPRFANAFAVGAPVIFVASGLIFGAVAWRLVATPVFPNGDEPHYLVITQSLLRDRDLKIENNHLRGDHREYLDGPLRPDYLTRGVDGQIYSIHPVGLAFLAMPAFAIGGYPGVVVMMVLMAALAAALFWQWARDVTTSTAAATFAWAAAALTTPYLFNSFTVFPEIPAALALMIAVAWRPESVSMPVMAVRGLALASLPWLSTKYAPMAAVATIVVIVRAGSKGPGLLKFRGPGLRPLAALLAPMAVSATGWFAFFYWIWGTFSPSAPYGSAQATTLTTLVRGGPGLLFDQEYGVIAYAPVLGLSFVGIALMLRSGGDAARRALEVVFMMGALLATVGAFYLWWGGTASPGRPLASGVLLLGIPIAWLFGSAASRPAARAVCHVLLASSLAIACAIALAQEGALLNNNRDGSAVLLDWLSPAWPASAAFPSFVTGGLAAAAGRTLAWLALACLIGWLVIGSRAKGSGAAASAAIGLGVAGTIVLASVMGASAEATPPPEARARIPLLDGFDARWRPNIVVYDPWSHVTGTELLKRVELVARPGLRTTRQPLALLWNARFALPAGEYRVQLTRPGPASHADTTVGVQIGRVGTPVEQWQVSGSAWEHPLILPVDAQFLGFRAPSDLDGIEGELRISPVRVVDERERIGRPPVLSATRYGAVTAFFHDDVTVGEPNGYWARGGATTRVTYATNAGAPALGVVVHCGPVANRVTLSAPGWEQTLRIEPGAPQVAAVPTQILRDLGVWLAPLDIDVQGGFVPAELDRASTDRRYLGCWFEVQQR